MNGGHVLGHEVLHHQREALTALAYREVPNAVVLAVEHEDVLRVTVFSGERSSPLFHRPPVVQQREL